MSGRAMLYDFLTWWQDGLVIALMGSSADRGGSANATTVLVRLCCWRSLIFPVERGQAQTFSGLWAHQPVTRNSEGFPHMTSELLSKKLLVATALGSGFALALAGCSSSGSSTPSASPLPPLPHPLLRPLRRASAVPGPPAGSTETQAPKPVASGATVHAVQDRASTDCRDWLLQLVA